MHLALIARSSPTRLSIWQRARGAMVVMGSSLQQVGSVQAKMLVFGGAPGGGSASGRLDKNHRCLLRLAWWVAWMATSQARPPIQATEQHSVWIRSQSIVCFACKYNIMSRRQSTSRSSKMRDTSMHWLRYTMRVHYVRAMLCCAPRACYQIQTV